MILYSHKQNKALNWGGFMHVCFYETTEAFLQDTEECLLLHEAQNNLLLANTQMGKSCDISDWTIAAVKEGNSEILLSAICAPPFNIVLYETGNRTNNNAVKLLADALKGTELPGVIAEDGLAERFSKFYAQSCAGLTYKPHMLMNIMELKSIKNEPYAPGYMRELTENDMYFAPYWEQEFCVDCKAEKYSFAVYEDKVRQRLNCKKHFIWQDDIPVSQAVNARETKTGAVVNGVYTPPMYRNKGYASACVYSLSRLLLEQGYAFTCLFADASNPISNKIYRNIGYEDICVYKDIRFNRPL